MMGENVSHGNINHYYINAIVNLKLEIQIII